MTMNPFRVFCVFHRAFSFIYPLADRKIPTVVVADNVRNVELVEALETLVNGWEKQVAAALEVQLKKTPQGNGPLAEIDFWRERNANLRYWGDAKL